MSIKSEQNRKNYYFLMEQNADTKVVLKNLFISLISTSHLGAVIVNALNEEQIANIENVLKMHGEQIDLLKEIIIGELL